MDNHHSDIVVANAALIAAGVFMLVLGVSNWAENKVFNTILTIVGFMLMAPPVIRLIMFTFAG